MIFYQTKFGTHPPLVCVYVCVWVTLVEETELQTLSITDADFSVHFRWFWLVPLCLQSMIWALRLFPFSRT